MKKDSWIDPVGTDRVKEYILSKFTLPLTYSGTMSLTATKAVDRLL